MPVINLEYDDVAVSEEEVMSLSKSVRDIVSETTSIQEVFVYANTAKIKIQIAPIEIFVQMSAHINKDNPDLMTKIKERLGAWKKEVGFKHPVNLTIIPMQWEIEIGI